MEDKIEEERAEFFKKFYDREIPHKKNQDRVCTIRFLDIEKLEEEFDLNNKLEHKHEEQ